MTVVLSSIYAGAILEDIWFCVALSSIGNILFWVAMRYDAIFQHMLPQSDTLHGTVELTKGMFLVFHFVTDIDQEIDSALRREDYRTAARLQKIKLEQ